MGQLLPEVPVRENRVDNKYIFYKSLEKILLTIDEIMTNFSVMDDRYSYERNNVVGVIGQRGSGKTSVLLTVQNLIEKNSCGTLFTKAQNIYVLEPIIEPRFFTSSHSILQLLVSKFYSSFKDDYSKSSDDNIRNQLISLFDEINQLVLYDVSCSKNEEEGDADSLNSFSSLFGIKEKLEKLISLFLDFENSIRNDSSSQKYTSVLVMVDDLDLDTANAYSMISQISKYLKIRGLIICIAYDRDTMFSVIKHAKYKEIYGDVSPFSDYFFTYDDEKTDENVRRFIEKLIPARYQILLEYEPQYSDYIELMVKLLTNDEKAASSSNYSIYSNYILGVVRNSTILRHINQNFNKLSSYLSVDFKDAKIMQSARHALTDTIATLFELPKGSTGKPFDSSFSSLDCLIVNNRQHNDELAFFYQCRFAEEFYLDAPNSSFSDYYLQSGILIGAAEKIIYLNGKDELDIFDVASTKQLNPLAFFVVLSVINSLPSRPSLAFKTYCDTVDVFYPNEVTQDKIFNLPSSSKNIKALIKLKDSQQIISDIKSVLQLLKRTRSKTRLSELKRLLKDGSAKNVFTTNSSGDIKKIIDKIDLLLNMNTNDSSFRSKVNEIVNDVNDITP